MNLRRKCREIGVPYGRIWARVNYLGWTEERALTEPVHENKVHIRTKKSA